jgi:hypothetical protein
VRSPVVLIMRGDTSSKEAAGEETGAKRGRPGNIRVGRSGNVVSPIVRPRQRFGVAQVSRETSCWASGYENAEKANGSL